jgi:hypothetical protein
MITSPEITSLRRAADNFRIPDRAGEYAWRRAWQLYRRLLDREAIPPDPTMVAADARAAAMQRDWNEYLVNRAQLLEWYRQERLTVDGCLVLGLLPGDLDPVLAPETDETIKTPNRRRPVGRLPLIVAGTRCRSSAI